MANDFSEADDDDTDYYDDDDFYDEHFVFAHWTHLITKEKKNK